MGLKERIAEMGEIARGDSDAGIGHMDQKEMRFGSRADRHAPFGRREFDRVGKKINENLGAGAFIAGDLGKIFRIGAQQFDPALLGVKFHHVATKIDQRRHGKGLKLNRQAAALDLRHV